MGFRLVQSRSKAVLRERLKNQNKVCITTERRYGCRLLAKNKK